MSTARIRMLIDFEIYDGKLDEFQALAKQMVEQFEQEPGTLAYHFVLSGDRKRCRLIQGYADQAAITVHWIDGPAVQRNIFHFQQVALPTRVEVYGDPGPKVAAVGRRVRRRDLYRVDRLRPVEILQQSLTGCRARATGWRLLSRWSSDRPARPNCGSTPIINLTLSRIFAVVEPVRVDRGSIPSNLAV